MNKESNYTFASYDGTKLEGTLHLPERNSEALVLLVHGITSSRDELGLYSGLAQHLAKHRMASFRFDYRCHGVNAGDLRTMTLAGIVNDIEAAYMFAHAKLRTKRVHAIGMSFGGGLTAFWAATTKARVHSVVMLAPVIDYQEDVLGQHGLIDKAHLQRKAIASIGKKGYVETDGIRYGAALINELPYINGMVGLAGLGCPTLILHGDADSIVPYSSSLRFAKMNSRCKLVNITGTDHGFGVPGDEDLTSPETKRRHAEVFEVIEEFLSSKG